MSSIKAGSTGKRQKHGVKMSIIGESDEQSKGQIQQGKRLGKLRYHGQMISPSSIKGITQKRHSSASEKRK